MHAYQHTFQGVSYYGTFLKSRLARIYPLHLLLLLAYLGLGCLHWTGIVHAEDGSKYDPQAILPNLFLVHAWGTTSHLTFNYPSWSISAEWLAYLLFPLAIWLARRGGAWAIACFALLIVVLLSQLEVLGYLPPWTRATFDGGALRALPGFFAGAALFVFVDRYRPQLKSFAPAIFLFAVGIVIMLLRIDSAITIVMAVGVVGLVAAAEIGGAKSIMHHPLLLRLGDASYAIYMIHPLIGTCIITVLGKRLIGLSDLSLLAWAILIAAPLNLLVAPIIFDKFERPMRKLVQSMDFGDRWRTAGSRTAMVAATQRRLPERIG